MFFKQILKKRLKITTDYIIISTIIIFGIVISSGFIIFITYKNNFDQNQRRLIKDGELVEKLLLDQLTEHHWYVRSLANKIKNSNNLKEINQIISSKNKLGFSVDFDHPINQKNIYWVDDNNNILIKNRVGILDYPKSISAELYDTNKAKNYPWNLTVSHNYSDEDHNLIPTSFGVTKNNGQYLGSIISFIDLYSIQNLLAKNLNSSDVNFVILDKNSRIILQSNQDEQIKNHDLFINKNINKGVIDKNGFKYNKEKQLSEYPFIVVTGYNNKLYKTELIRSLIKSVIPIFGIGILLLGTLYLFYKRTIKPIEDLCNVAIKFSQNDYQGYKIPREIGFPRLPDLIKALLKIKHQKIKIENRSYQIKEAKQKLEESIEIANRSDLAQINIFKQIREEINKNTSQIYQNLNILKYNLENHSNQLNNSINLHLIKTIEQEINNITKFATDELNKEYIDIKQITDRAVSSQEKEMKIRNIDLEVLYDKNLPKKIFVDQIRLTQILSSILNKTVKLLIEGQKIELAIKNITKDKKRYLAISIQDNGIGIGIKDHDDAAKKLGALKENAISGIDISLSTIEELVALHGGNITYQNKINNGSKTTITIPYSNKETAKIIPVINEKIDNIVQLPIKKDRQ